MEKIKSIIGVDVKSKYVLFRPDINSPIDQNGKIVSQNRLKKTVPTLQYLLSNGAKVAIIAHQGDTLDYQNLIPLSEHAEILSKLSGYNVEYIDDVCGLYAIEKVKNLKDGQCVILGNLRYLTEEVSTFEKDVKLAPKQMLNTYLVRTLAPLFDIYVNDAFSAAHRNCPSMVAFQELLPSYAGPLFFNEYSALEGIMSGAKKPCVFILGGAKISDAFGMMKEVLSNNSCDHVLACGVTGIIMQLSKGLDVGEKYYNWLKDKDLLTFIEPSKELLALYGDRFILPSDFAFEKDGKRQEVAIEDLPVRDAMLLDIGSKTVEQFINYIDSAGTIFVNGPCGVYENPLFEYGTKRIWNALAESKAYTVIGGGDTVSAAGKFIDLQKISYVCTAGGAMVRFLSGKKLPLIEAMLHSL